MAAPLADIFGYGGTTVVPGTPLTATSPLIQKLIDAGIISQTSRDFSNESGQGNITMNNVDWTQLPALGPPGVGNQYGNWISAGPDPSGLINPNMVYNDPNYGLVTPAHNAKVNQSNWYDMIGPGLVGLASFGLGVPWYLGAGLSAAKVGGSLLDASQNGIGSVGNIQAPNTMHWSEIFASPKDDIAKSGGAANVISAMPTDYNPALYGNFGSLAAPADGSAPVATGIAPAAYDNSNNYNSVVT